ncbi:MAG: DUF1552 domain-containing protein [Deltaproteobacteria bacterium]|nr:MAG: DUF1552 domain-containing protein [Deltaproteobacteria bacterium]
MNRRTFLRSAAATLALPTLTSALPRAAWAGAPGTPPVRLVFWYVPNGMVMDRFRPLSTGFDYTLNTITAPLAGVRDDVTVLTGLENAAASVPLAGDHARGTGSFLTCRTVTQTAGADIENGISVDQVFAQATAGQTPFPSIELGTEGGDAVGDCDSGYSCAYVRNISWAGVATPLPKITDPRLAFSRLFAGYDPTVTAEEIERRKQLRLSVIDYVLEDANALHGRLGRTDQLKLDEYLTAVRQLETRIELLGDQQCVPGEAPDSSLDVEGRVQAMNDLMVLALQCDLTRVATFMLGNGGSNRAYDFLGVTGAHHEISHHGNDATNLANLTTIDTWEVAQFADLVQKLGAVQEADGSRLLDHTLAYFSSEISDGDWHNHNDLPVLLAGGGGGAVLPGRHVELPAGTPMANLFLTMLNAAGVAESSFGQDSTGLVDLS